MDYKQSIKAWRAAYPSSPYFVEQGAHCAHCGAQLTDEERWMNIMQNESAGQRLEDECFNCEDAE